MLPDEGDRLLHSITTHLKKAKREVYIFTPLIDEYAIIRSLKKTAKSDVKITLITDESIRKDQNRTGPKNQSAYLSLFQNISVFTLSTYHNDQDSGSELHGSLICIDDEELFLVTHSLSTQKLKSDYAFALHQKMKCNTLFEPLLERSKPY